MTPKLRITRKRLLVLAVIAAAWVLLAWAAGANLIVAAPLEHADVIVVLSGSASYDERTRHAAELYRARVAPEIILTNDNHQGGWSQAEQRNPYFYERALQALIREGVPPEHIRVLSEPVYSTHDEAVLLRRQADSNAFKSMIVVTSAYHSKRALWILRKNFDGSEVKIGMQPVPTGFQTPRPATWWLHRRGWQDVPSEYFKMVEYWLLY
jgi:uncharacterized SAM-binding protein YcdF (DUF218 family)